MASLMEYRRRIFLNTPHLETVSGSVAHFSTDMASKLKECKVNFLPQQAGSGDPSPSNVRSISGWTGCDVVHSGKNLINDQTAVIYDRTTSPNGWSTSNTAKSITLKVKPNSTYTISCDSSLAILRGGTINVDPTTVGSSRVPFVNFVDSASIIGQRKFYTITTSVDDIWLVVQGLGERVTARTAQIQVELGSESTEYEPYQSNQITVSWDNLGTIYCGFIDVLRGELVQEYSHIVVDGENITITNISTSTPDRYRWNTANSGISNMDFGRGKQTAIMASNMPCTENATSALTSILPSIDVGHYTPQFFIAVPLDYPSTIEDANAWLQQNPIDVVYKLATPITYPLSPEIIKAIKGVNNVFSDANGDVSVKYWKH